MHGILFAPEKCLQCHSCETACKSWRGVAAGVAWRRVHNLWSGRYPQVKRASASVACLHCVEPSCAQACPEGAIAKRVDSGLVLVDPETCTGCRACLDACPYDVPKFGAAGTMEKCDLCAGHVEAAAECPPCVATCPTGALAYGEITAEEKRAEEKRMRDLLRRAT